MTMHKLAVLPCVTLLAAAATATSAPQVPANQIAPSDPQQAANLSGGKATEAVQDKKICKQLPSSTSRLPNRVCLTEKEWKQVEEDMSR
jgi:hypothetical protein